MFPRHMFARLSVVAGVVATMMLAVTPPVEAVSPTETVESTLDEPRHTQTVKAFGPYRLNIPTTKTLTAKIVNVGPKWTNNSYVIKAGDVLSKLAKPLGHSVSKLAACSGLVNPDRISIGFKLRKPDSGSCVKAPPVPATQPQTAVVPSTPPASGIAATVIAFAKAQLGDPYVWGADGPNSWDCSGLVRAAFASAGISTTRTTRTLINEGRAVSQSALTLGDLVFTHKGHVGIYVGGNQIIHAPQAGDVVKISTIWSFWAGRRLI